MSKGETPELYVERNGWSMQAVSKDGVVLFHAEHKSNACSVLEFGVNKDSLERLNLLVNLEEVMGIREINPMRARQVRPAANVEWCAYENVGEDIDVAPEFPFCIRFTWTWHTDDHSFGQQNVGELSFTKEEVETLHRIFKGD